MSDILAKIIEYKRLQLEQKRREISLRDQQKKSADTEPALKFFSNFESAEINIIAEVKKASPSAGIIRENFHPVDIARIYEDNGAVAISVLTDEKFFQGCLKYLNDVRSAVKLPLLRKDFTVSDYDVFEARANGADAVLLIAAVLDDFELKDFRDVTVELGMSPLVEVHSKTEFERCAKIGFEVVGVNNRDLKTFKTDISTTKEILKMNHGKSRIISESGLKDHQALSQMLDLGVFGFLIGESLLRSKDIAAELRKLRGIL